MKKASRTEAIIITALGVRALVPVLRASLSTHVPPVCDQFKKKRLSMLTIEKKKHVYTVCYYSNLTGSPLI
jgi:hypothetical protein